MENEEDEAPANRGKPKGCVPPCTLSCYAFHGHFLLVAGEWATGNRKGLRLDQSDLMRTRARSCRHRADRHERSSDPDVLGTNTWDAAGSSLPGLEGLLLEASIREQESANG